MGVTGLWSVVAPTARPTKLETLNRKRLAIDASIWIYQFLKAVRDKEGNALRNSHVVGFFRRICKLLYFGIQPVFVFDGGAPGLKRETIQKRQRRREGRREDATRTAGKLLAVQVARAAEDEGRRRREARQKEEDESIKEGEDLVYVEEIGMSVNERQKERAGRFKRKDQYHLPDLDISLEAMGAPNDPRIMSQAELEEYARQFHSGEDINLYDFSKIDFESPFFLSLPAGDRYNILNAARLRSRLRMGYSKEQLDGMFPNRMDFSRFQIERVKERNDLTQRLMHINGMNEELSQGGRIAGEKGKEYILVKNDGVEGGWALGVVSNRHGAKREDAIDVDDEQKSMDDQLSEAEDDEDFEDVAIEGLNRLPMSMRRNKKDLCEVDYDISYEQAAEEIARKRKAVYENRRKAIDTDAPRQVQKPESRFGDVERGGRRPENDLFVAQDHDSDHSNDLFEDVPMEIYEEEDEELERAIAMSLEPTNEPPERFLSVNQESAVAVEALNEDDELDLATALAESRHSKNKSAMNVRQKTPPQLPSHNFNGPLPFESLNLGQSLLGKKKADKIQQDMSGGFDKDAGEDAFRKPPKPQPIPSWFKASVGGDFANREHESDLDDHVTHGREDVDRRETLRRHQTREVIDVDATDFDATNSMQPGYSYVNDSHHGEFSASQEQDVESPFREASVEAPESVLDDESERLEKERAAHEREERYKIAREIAAGDEDDEAEGDSMVLVDRVAERVQANAPRAVDISASAPKPQTAPSSSSGSSVEHDDEVEWSDSDHEDAKSVKTTPAGTETFVEEGQDHPDREIDVEDENDDFENVDLGVEPSAIDPLNSRASPLENDKLFLVEGDVESDVSPDVEHEAQADGIDGYLSESEEELMRQLALEAEGHAEFASQLNQIKTPAQAQQDYENELKQLRNQQKKDRRDADEVTQVMVQECQALLRLFGLPYVTAPMEAEAQCAELVHLGLVDGIVTDDSDIFLFGGTRIYKNMFNAAKFVECYVLQDLEKEYDLDRRKLIRFAHLLGSDYTEGLPGIGPVTALEIISDFPDLDEFKEWCLKVQLGRPQDLENQLSTPFRRKFKKTVQKRLFLPPAFPDQRVDHAYLSPEVDSNPEGFQWGLPDLDKLRSFLMATIGWTQDRTDEILVPVVRDMNKRQQEGTQANLTRFFTGGAGVGAAPVEGTAPRNRTGKESGRMKNAYARLRNEARKKRWSGEDSEKDDFADDEDIGSGAGINQRSEMMYNSQTEKKESDSTIKAGERRSKKRRTEV